MPHSHDHRPESDNRAFAIGVTLNVAFVAVESIYGVLAGSLALVADAGHNLSDVLGLLLAWGASLLAQRKPTATRTYGLRRGTVLAALLSSLLLLVASGAIAWEAVGRFMDPAPVGGLTVIVVASIGVVINTATALLFVSGRKTDLNIKGAYLHMAADAGVSLGVVVAGLAIIATGWEWLDPTISLAIVAIIFVGTWGLLKDSVDLALDAVPKGIDPVAVLDYLSKLPGVVEVHDLHIWGMSTTEAALTVHLVIPQGNVADGFLCEVANRLHDQFDIQHSTIQIEREYSPCRQASPDTV